METFGEWLRRQRERRRLTRQEFASRIGCSVAMLRKMEDDERRPSDQIAGLIAHTLDLQPAEREVFVKVARGELGLDRLGSFVPGVSPVQRSSRSSRNLPVLPTPLIGRESELEEIRKLLHDPHCRMLTLTGPGGIGKTRLAIEAATQLETDFADGVYFIPLAAVQAARFIVPMIAESIGFVFQGEHSLDPRLQLFDYLDGKQLLLLVDNLEHLLGDPAVAEIFAGLMEQTAQLKLLVTSRESVGLQVEWIFDIHGLPVPEGIAVEGTSLELFLQRARRAQVGFTATTEEYPAIRRICRLVEGMPLGIELAAAWVRTLSCEEIAREIERGLDFLSVSAKDLPARHRSLRAVFDHSWQLLSEEEGQILLQLSVFQGGFQLDAAQQIAGASLAVLAALVTKSLTRRSSTGRYDLHELIQQYAFERLAAHPDLLEDVRRRHGEYFLSYLCQQDVPLRSTPQRESLAHLIADIDNIRSAQEWALAHREFALIESTLRAYSTFFDTLGWSQEGLDYLGRVRAVLDSLAPLAGRTEQLALAHVLTTRGLFAFRAGQHEESRLMLERSLEILRPLQEPRVLEEALTFLGIVTAIMGEPARAVDLFREGLQVAREIGDEWYAALCLTELVGMETLLGKVEGAHEQLQSAVDAWRRTGDLRFTAFGLNFLSFNAMLVGKHEEARRALEESIVINAAVGDRWGLGIAQRGLGLVAQAQGQHREALEPFQESLQLFHELGARWEVARVKCEMARSLFALGHEAEAEDHWCESLQLSVETQGLLTAMEAIVGLARLRAGRGDSEYALHLLIFSLRHPATLPETKMRAESLASELKESLTPQQIESAQALAEVWTFESVVDGLLR